MNLYQKVSHPTNHSLVIKVLILILSFSCSAQKKEIENNHQSIVKAELLRHSSFYENNKVYLDFNLDDYLVSFIEKNETDSITENINLLKQIRADEIQSIFNKDEVKYLINNLKKTNSNIKISSFSSNIIVGSKKQLSAIDKLENKKINLSKPTITKNKKYALIAYSYGKNSSMQGGISIYHKINATWQFYKSVDNWIE